MFVYAIWKTGGEYEGEDVLLGVFSDYVKTREKVLELQSKDSDCDFYAWGLELDRLYESFDPKGHVL